MSSKWIAIRNCYYLKRYWQAGESLNDTGGYEDAPPGKHFALDGKIPAGEIDSIVRPGDDPRSTVQIRKDLEEIHGVDTKGVADRKDLFNLWTDAEKAKAAEAAPPVPDGVEIVDPLGTRKFSDLSPDELNELKNQELADSMKVRFGLDVKYKGIPKENLIQQALQLEVQSG